MKIFTVIMLYKINYLNKSCIFFKGVLPHIISGPWLEWL